MFADLHCHPSNRIFNSLRQSKNDPFKDFNEDNVVLENLLIEQTLWHQTPEDTKKKKKQLEKGFTGDMANFPQCDIKSLTDSNTRIVFAAIYPLEKGFFLGNKKKGISAKSLTSLISRLIIKSKQISGNFEKILLIIIQTVLRKADPLANILINNKGLGRDCLQKSLMRFSRPRIDYIQSNKYDYFREATFEYNLYKYGDNKIPPKETEVNTYQLIKDNNHLNEVLNSTDHISIILTLEGINTLSQKSEKNKLVYVGWDELKRRIHTIKSWNVFFITFCHHYSNELAGHARSLPQLLQEISDQEPLKNRGIDEISADGMKAIRELVSVGKENSRDNSLGRRILIDVKHMAPKARKEYYDFIKSYNEENPNDKIPVIASHMGYANIKSLDDLIKCQDEEKDNSFKDGFLQWSINLCDEDIRIIVASGGIIGLCFDQRIIGVDLEKGNSLKKKEKGNLFKKGQDTSAEWIEFFRNNILGFIQSCSKSDLNNEYKIWNCISLGTDFDGFIDVVNPFGTAERFEYFFSMLLESFNKISQQEKEKYGLNGNPYTPEEVIEKIAWKNAYEFTLSNFK
ncbi:amidohydrolase family protein [Algoriphagus taiwanensis]|uniref:Membrane dipeptidase (Peptidase family M19) n=1 Tax=Algoriphagus taiwanensis TaxID=1445656 RepID=A0ABQ6PW67_9BACT|nr:hypothetical protein Ataiwa_04750 [Algoriphagus taiwanensis]